MKIKINENESYEIMIPDEVRTDEFMGLLERMNKIQKLFVKDVVWSEEKKEKRVYNTTKKRRVHGVFNEYKQNREMCVNLLRAYYLGNVGFMKEFCEAYNFDDISDIALKKKISEFKKMHDIKPVDVGLKRFPGGGRHRPNINELRLEGEPRKEVSENAVVIKEEKEERNN